MIQQHAEQPTGLIRRRRWRRRLLRIEIAGGRLPAAHPATERILIGRTQIADRRHAIRTDGRHAALQASREWREDVIPFLRKTPCTLPPPRPKPPVKVMEGASGEPGFQ